MLYSPIFNNFWNYDKSIYKLGKALVYTYLLHISTPFLLVYTGLAPLIAHIVSTSTAHRPLRIRTYTHIYAY